LLIESLAAKNNEQEKRQELFQILFRGGEKGMKAVLRATTDFFGWKFWEVDVYQDENRLPSVNINLDDLKRHGVTNTLNGKKKMLEWVNESNDGQEYLKQKVEDNRKRWLDLASEASKTIYIPVE